MPQEKEDNSEKDKNFSSAYGIGHRHRQRRQLRAYGKTSFLSGRLRFWVVIVALAFIAISGGLPFILGYFQQQAMLQIINLKAGEVNKDSQGVSRARLSGMDEAGNKYRVFSQKIVPKGRGFLLSQPSLTISQKDSTWLQAKGLNGEYSASENRLSLLGDSTFFYSERNIRLRSDRLNFFLDSKELKTDQQVNLESDFITAEATKGLSVKRDEITFYGPLTVTFYPNALKHEGDTKNNEKKAF